MKQQQNNQLYVYMWWHFMVVVCVCVYARSLELSHFATIYKHISNVTKSKFYLCIHVSACVHIMIRNISKNHILLNTQTKVYIKFYIYTLWYISRAHTQRLMCTRQQSL